MTTGIVLYIIIAVLLVVMALLFFRLRDSQRALAHTRDRQRELAEENVRLRTTMATMQSDRDHAIERLAEHKAQQEVMKEELRREFSIMAERIIEEKSAKVTGMQSDKLNQLLDPLKFKLEEFRHRIDETYSRESLERNSLKTVIEQLSKQSQLLSSEANALTEALRGDSKVQGDWGELVLQRILENSGLTLGREYELQPYLKDEQGKPLLNRETLQRMRPDAIVHLTQGREVIIDAKVSLTSYVDFHEADNEQERKSALSKHLISVRNHINELQRRDYSAYLAGSPSFVILFFPYDGALNLALQAQPNLWQEAYNAKVLLMGPLNLIGMLYILYDMWNKEFQEQNIRKIIEAADKMYDKYANFTQSFAEVGSIIDRLSQTYERSKGQLTSGVGNLSRQMTRFREMGLTTTKRLAPELMPQDEPVEGNDGTTALE